MYQFSKLSPNEFETLAVDIVGKMNNIFFQRFTEGPDGGIDGFYESSDNNWIVQAKRYKNTTTLMSKMQQEKEKMDNYIPKRYFLVTSCSLTPANKEKIKLIMTPYILSTNDILGEDELISLVKEYPEILTKSNQGKEILAWIYDGYEEFRLEDKYQKYLSVR